MSSFSGTSWSAPVNLGDAVQDNQFGVALDSTGSGLVLGTSPAFGYPVLASQSATFSLASSKIAEGSETTGSGTATPAAAGRPVELQVEKSGLWYTTATTTESASGAFSFTIKGSAVRPFGFPRETPNAFAEDSEGGIWIGTQGTDAMGGARHGGLYRYREGHVEKVLSGDVLSVVNAGDHAVLASFATEASGKAAYGDLYLFREADGRWSGERVKEKAADHMTVDRQGTVLFPCPGGWCEIDRAQISDWLKQHRQIIPASHAGGPLVERVLRDHLGCIWFRSEISASYQCPSDQAPIPLPQDISATDTSAHLEETPDGEIFMLVRMILGRPGKFHVANTESGLPRDIDTAIVARDGTIWIGSETGLYRFMYPFRMQYWTQADGVQPAISLARAGDAIFAGGAGIDALHANRTRWEEVQGGYGLGNAVAAGPEGKLFAAGTDRFAEFGSNRSLLGAMPIPHSFWGTSLATSTDGTAWLGDDIVYRINGQDGDLSLQAENFPSLTGQDLGQNISVPDVEYDRTNRVVWACYGKSVLFKKGSSWQAITQRDGLLDQPCYSVAPLPDGNVWVGYSNANFSFIRDPMSGHPHVQNFTPYAEELAGNNSVHLFAADQRGRLWRGSDKLYVSTQQAAEAGNWVRLDANDGIVNSVGTGHAFVADPDGSIWFSTDTGVEHFSPPDDFVLSFPAPSVFISGFSHGSDAQLAGTFGEMPRAQKIEAHIGSLQFDRRSALQIRYRLLPAQSAWTASNDLDIPLGSPGWGHHTLEVQARLATGPWSSTLAQSFAIPPPVWLNWPALSGYLLATVALVTGGRRWRRKRMEKLGRGFPDLSEMRLAALSPELQQVDGGLLDSRFEVGRVLARGGFATVAEGRDRLQNRRCAIKIFRQDMLDKDWIARRFEQEVLALEQIRHPSVVGIYGSGTLPGGALYLVMEFIEGNTLREILENGRLPLGLTASYLRQAGNALGEIHRRGVCHRDLKPENLMIRAAGPPGAELGAHRLFHRDCQRS